MNEERIQNFLAAFKRRAGIVDKWWAKDIRMKDPLRDEAHTDKEMIRAALAPYSNTDPTNGIGLHKFTPMEYISGPNRTCPDANVSARALKNSSDCRQMARML